MATPSPVDRLYAESSAVICLLGATSELSLQVTAGDHFRKALLMAAASHFENQICACVIDFVREKAVGAILVENFVKNKAVSRQYHTWFKWDENNANQFFGFFGSEFRTMMVAEIKESDALKNSVKAFLEVGNERNKLVHQDYATFALEKTLDEIYALYQQACYFVDCLPEALRRQ
jgi:hypothetical protein